MQSILVMFRSSGERRSFSVTREITVLGRRDDCDLIIPLGEVSRKHARLVRDGDLLKVEDLGSANGTFLNGQRVQESLLAPGDTIQVGPVVFVLQIDGVPADDELQPVYSEGAAMAAGGAAAVAAASDVDVHSGHPEDEQSLEDLEPMEEPAPAEGAADDLPELEEPVSEGAEEPADELEALEPIAEDDALADLDALEPISIEEEPAAAAETPPAPVAVEQEPAELEALETLPEEPAVAPEASGITEGDDLEPIGVPDESSHEAASDEPIALDDLEPIALDDLEPIALDDLEPIGSDAGGDEAGEVPELAPTDEHAPQDDGLGELDLLEIEPEHEEQRHG